MSSKGSVRHKISPILWRGEWTVSPIRYSTDSHWRQYKSMLFAREQWQCRLPLQEISCKLVSYSISESKDGRNLGVGGTRFENILLSDGNQLRIWCLEIPWDLPVDLDLFGVGPAFLSAWVGSCATFGQRCAGGFPWLIALPSWLPL